MRFLCFFVAKTSVVTAGAFEGFDEAADLIGLFCKDCAQDRNTLLWVCNGEAVDNRAEGFIGWLIPEFRLLKVCFDQSDPLECGQLFASGVVLEAELVCDFRNLKGSGLLAMQ